MSQHQHTVPPAVGGIPVVPAERTTAVDVPAPAAPLVRRGDPDLGATTVEYAMVVLAAAAFGGVMAAVLSSGQVRELLTALITSALSV